MSTTFDENFEIWLNEHLQSIKSLSGALRHRSQLDINQKHSQQQSAVKEQVQPHSLSQASHHSTANYQLSTSVFCGSLKPALLVAMSRPEHGNSDKRGGSYYRFAYDEDDVQSLDNVVDDENSVDDEKHRRQRLTRILGDQCPDFESENGFEMDEDFNVSQPFDENRNVFSAVGGKLAESRAHQYSTTSLEFSDVGSEITDPDGKTCENEDWTGLNGGENYDGYNNGGLDGFIEFSRVRDLDETISDGQITDLGNDEDPLRFEAIRSRSGGHQKLLPTALVAAISGRVIFNRKTIGDSSKTTIATSAGGGFMQDMVAVKYHKTNNVLSDGETPGGDFMDDDDILVHPLRHQLPIGSSSSNAAKSKIDDFMTVTQSFLPTELSMDIITADAAFSSPDFDDGISDDIGMHSKDLDPIVKSPSSPKRPKSRSLSQQLVRTMSNVTATANMSRCSGKWRRILIAGGAIIGLLMLIGIGVAIYLIVL